MKKLLLLLLLLPLLSAAQVTDDFSDANFTSNPTWTGDTADFKISTYSNSAWSQQPRLQLDGTVAGTSHARLATPLANLNNMEWDFWIRMAFGTSSANNARVYLVSDNADLEGSLNGYYVMFGDDVNDALDSISFWKQTGMVTTKLIHGHIANTGASRNYRVKVTRDNAGLWDLGVDTLGLSNFQSEGTITDNSFTTSAAFGVYCRFTLTNKTNFYFDDIYVGPQIIDTVAPEILSVTTVSQNEVDVAFSEFVEVTGAQNTANYNVPGIGAPSTAILDGSDATLVHLTFGSTFISGQVYQLEVSNIEDLSTNVMVPVSVPFSWYIAQMYDVVINEIMADPDPPVGLPNYEYLEIHNRTAVPVSLKDWTLEMGSTNGNFPDISIAANGYLILTGQGAVADLSPYGACAGFSSFSLTNSGTTLRLKDNNGVVMHSLTYSSSWYHDASKSGGGWSIEQIDPDNPCAGESNWRASDNVLGGTPGTLNSVMASNPDNQAPRLISIVPDAGNGLTLIFNEVIASAVLSNTAAFFVDQAVGNPVSATPGADEKSVRLLFSLPFATQAVYTLYITDTITDCVGNFSAGDSMNFSLYQPEQFGIVINEIMADPDPVVGLPNVEYIELYNKTGYPISLKGYSILIGTSNKIIPEVSIPALGYLVLCPTGYVSEFLTYGYAAEVSSLTITNTGTSLTLLDTLRRVISSVTFSDSWYLSSVKSQGGWSIEQIDPLNPCAGASNWIASVDVRGGTPGSLNSVYAPNPDVTNPVLTRASVSRLETTKVRLFFSEPLDSVSLLDPAKYMIDNGIGNPMTVKLVPPDYASVILTLNSALQNDIIYTATLTDSVFDCVGNLLPLLSSARFAIPAIADSGDIVINEVLSNPSGDGVDFVELVNRSTRIFDLRELYLAEWDTLANVATDLYAISTDGYLLFPGEYAALTTDPDLVKIQYRTTNPNGFAKMESFPSLNNDDGVVTLCTQTMELIDLMVYTADMQFPLLSSTDGVSLERINFNRPSLDKTNWHSAAESAGFATPAYLNSQYSEAVSDDGAVTLSPDIFSPDNSGYNDVLNISYQFAEPGYIANINIYDNNGRLVRKLIQNELLGTTGIFSWDGVTEDNEKANIGIYIVYFEVYNEKGDVKRYKRAAVLAQRMK